MTFPLSEFSTARASGTLRTASATWASAARFSRRTDVTHTLHRAGGQDSLSRDIVFTYMPSKNINHVGSAPQAPEISGDVP